MAQDELGAVVLRTEPGGRRALRRLLLCAAFLLLMEVALRVALPPDPRLLRDPLHPYGCFREETLAALVAARQADPAPVDVVLIGDSVLASVNNPPGERVEDYLAPRLAGPGRPVRVWNLGSGGAHAADQYGALRQLLSALGPRPGRLLVVLSSNVIFFSRRHRSPAMLYPCLGESFADDTEALALLRLPQPPSALERHLARWLAEHVYLFQQRRRLGEALFGGPPRETLRTRLLFLLGHLGLRPQGALQPEITDPNLPWTERGLSAAQFAASYDFVPLGTPEAVNHRMTLHLARSLGRAGVPAFAFLVPQNHALLGPLADGPAYHAVGQAIRAAFTGAGVPFRSYDGLVEGGLFTDLDHLTAAGNARLAALLAEDLRPRLAAPGAAP